MKKKLIPQKFYILEFGVKNNQRKRAPHKLDPVFSDVTEQLGLIFV